ncbi:MAG: hypothetical protein AAF533_24975 [Acidobacteriota bacterium]
MSSPSVPDAPELRGLREFAQRHGNTACPDAVELAEHQAGTLDEERMRAISDHLATCDECSQERAAIDEAETELGFALDLERELRQLARLKLPESEHELVGALRDEEESGDSSLADALARQARGEHESAVEPLQALWDDGDRGLQVALALGTALLHVDRAEDALSCLRQACRKAPASSEARWMLGQCQLCRGDGKAALRELEKVAARPGVLRAPAEELAGAVRRLLAK